MKKLLLLALLAVSVVAHDRVIEVEDLQNQDFLICYTDVFATMIDGVMIIKMSRPYIVDLDTKQAYSIRTCIGLK